MCRMVGYVGPAMAQAELWTGPPHSLHVQSYRPREMASGTVNADGFGAALWLDDGAPEPALYRTAAPMWADPNLGWISTRLRARAALAAVRSATPGMGFDLSSVQPFTHGRLGFVHNGFIERFHRGPKRAIRHTIGIEAYESVEGTSDSEHIFGLVLDEGHSARPEAAMAAALARLRVVCDAERVKAVATVMLCDGEALYACRWSAGGPEPATLYAAAAGEGHCLASEPLDPAQPWLPIPPQHVVIARPGAALRVEALR